MLLLLVYFKKIFLPFLAVLALAVGLAVGVHLLKQRQNLATPASVNLVDLSFSTPKTTLVPGEQFDVSILIDAKNFSVSAASVSTTFSTSIFQVLSFSPGPFFTQNIPSGYSQPLIRINPGIADPAVASIILGVACPQVVAVPNPTSTPCLVKSGAGVLATLTLKVKTLAPVGPAQLSFISDPNKTAIAAIGYDISVLGDAPVLKLTVSSPASPTPTLTPRPTPTRTPTPTATPTKTPTSTPTATASPTPTGSPSPSPIPTPTGGGLVGDVNGDEVVNIIDIGILIDNYGSSPPTNPRADLNKDGIVNIIDIGIVVDNYGI